LKDTIIITIVTGQSWSKEKLIASCYCMRRCQGQQFSSWKEPNEL